MKRNNDESVKSEKSIILSMIIPVFNEEKYIKRCVESIIDQMLLDDEIIIIDNNSWDNTLKICRDIEEKYENVHVYLEHNQGVSAARNKGLELARGNYVMFVDGDDFLPIGILSRLRSYIQQYPDKIIQGNIIPDTEYFSGNFEESPMAVLKSSECMQKIALYPTKYKVTEKEWILNSVYGVFGKIFPQQLISTMRFEENIALGEDLLFYLQALNRTDMVVVISENIHIVNSSNTNSCTRRINPALADSVAVAADKLVEMCRGGDEELQEDIYYSIFRHIEVGVIDQIKKMCATKTLVEMKEYITRYAELRQDIYQKSYQVILKKKYTEGFRRYLSYYVPIIFLKNRKYFLYCICIDVKERFKQCRNIFFR